jgi:hypothetical protein
MERAKNMIQTAAASRLEKRLSFEEYLVYEAEPGVM